MVDIPDRADPELIRVRLLLLLMLLVFSLLGLALWRVQVVRGSEFQQDLEKQSVRGVRLPGMRGRIFDRHDECLADNRPSYGLAIYLEELRHVRSGRSTQAKLQTLVEELSQVLELEPMVDDKAMARHVQRRLPLPLMAWRDLDEAAVARFVERASLVPAVELIPEVARVYPQGQSACHVVGYVSRTNMVQHALEDFNYYNQEMIGKSGIEKRFDGVLRGQAGAKLLRVDVAGFRHEDLAVREPKQGSDVRLAIDLKAQRLTELALRDTVGAAVVMNPNNGDVLAMASSPGFDPNQFVPFLRTEDWQELRENPGNPMLNRSIAGTYTPGSIFKPVVAFAALENEKIGQNTSFTCPGYYTIGNHRYNCWRAEGHGTVNARDALRYSCNVFFFQVGRSMGSEYIYHMAAALGLGQKMGVGLDAEIAGILPDARWKRDHMNEGWYEGDTCIFAIGQGPITTTPLQMAVMTSSIANRGVVYKPRMVLGLRAPDEDEFREIPPQIENEMNWSDLSLSIVRGGMFDAVMARDGTGRRARVPGVEMAGKTGTAEYGPKKAGKKRGWMIAFAPFDHPEYAVALVIDDAQGGGFDAAPRVQRILAGLMDIPLPVVEEEDSHG